LLEIESLKIDLIDQREGHSICSNKKNLYFK